MSDSALFRILALNQISAVGLKRFPPDRYTVGKEVQEPDAVLVRSQDMHQAPIAASVLVLLAPLAAAQSMPTTEEIIWPETGTFAAYPAERLDGRIWRPFVYGALHWDDNIFRLSSSANTQAILGTSDRSDMVRRLGAGIRADIPISLQRVVLEASIEDNHFDTFDRLDYVGHRLTGIWRWQVGRQLSGDAGGTTRKVLGGYGDLATGTRNLVTENRGFASAGYMVTPRWRVRGAVDASDVEHSDPARAVLETRTASTTLGVDYMTPGASSVGGHSSGTRSPCAPGTRSTSSSTTGPRRASASSR